MPGKKENRYRRLLEHIFFDKDFGAYKEGTTRIEFEREDLERAAKALKFKLPKNKKLWLQGPEERIIRRNLITTRPRWYKYQNIYRRLKPLTYSKRISR